jgi:tRNA (cmo5U34)-methyltransferase
MRPDEVKAVFDQQAAGYDTQWARMSPIRNALYFLLESLFVDLPAKAKVLCVGVGTGTELAHLAQRFPEWTFTAVDPSGPMLEVCRRRAREEGFEGRCAFHEGYLDSLSAAPKHDAATCFLVSQFILDRSERAAFFRSIADRLVPGGTLTSSDLATEPGARYETLLRAWMNMLSAGGVSPEGLERLRKAYSTDVAVIAPEEVESIIAAGGFESPTQFFQTGLIRAWHARTHLASNR